MTHTPAPAADRWHTSDTTDRYAAIHHAITVHLLTATEPPTRRNLINTGLHASNQYIADEMHHHGYDRRNPNTGNHTLPGFLRYWQHTSHSPWDERLIDAIALTQIWPLLTPLQQQALTALALTDDHQAAASALGVPWPTYAARLRNARRAVAALWHEHETPRPPRRDKRVLSRSGTYRGRHLLTEQDLERLREQRAEGATLRQLAEETGYSAGALCNLLRGKRRPAAGGEAA